MKGMDVCKCDCGEGKCFVLVEVGVVDPGDHGRAVQRLHKVQHHPLVTPALKIIIELIRKIRHNDYISCPDLILFYWKQPRVYNISMFISFHYTPTWFGFQFHLHKQCKQFKL